MIEDVHNHIRTCERCTRYKQPQEKEKIKPIHCTYPLELVHVNFLKIGKEGTDLSNASHENNVEKLKA